MKDTEQPKINRRFLIGVAIYAILFLAVVLIANLREVNRWLAGVLALLKPILIGLALAYLANPFFRFFERKLLVHVRPAGFRRGLSLLLTYLLLILIIAGLILLIVPQLVSSIQNFVANFDSHLTKIIGQINVLIGKINASIPPREDGSPAIGMLDKGMIMDRLTDFWNRMLKELEHSFRPENLGFIKNFFSQTTGFLTSLIVGFFVSLYMLASKEKRYAQVMKFRKAYFSDRTNAMLTHAFTVADRSFGGFLRGKLLDSTIVGILVYITCLIFGIPYAVLVAVVVGITDVIPVIGPFLGVIPTAVIILLTDPIKVVIFLLSILVIQQIDGNIIAPKILGENTGVSSLCVMIAIILMGNLWGLFGMLVGVPLFATVIELGKLFLEKRLREKGLSPDGSDAAPPLPEPAEAPDRALSVGGAGDLTRLEQVHLRTYALARKYRIFHDLTDESMTEFAEEAAELFARVEAEERAEQHSGAENASDTGAETPDQPSEASESTPGESSSAEVTTDPADLPEGGDRA